MHASDTARECVVNHTLVKKLGIATPAEIVGQRLFVNMRWIDIVGVTEDLHQHSLRYAHEPLMFTTRKEFYWEAGLKLNPVNIPETLAAIRKSYDAVLPEQVFSGRFLDERIAEFYADDRRLSATSKAFGLLAILISCLGLYGLATHAAAQRVKEIGIRKVLGASIPGILALLSVDFLKLVVIALVAAAPLAWYVMRLWLNNFEYRIDFPWIVFLLAGVIALTIAFATISFQSLRAALANPVKSLRSE
jgi:putative ABC transport system permease protein